MSFFRKETTFWRENAADDSLNSGEFGGHGSCMNNLLRASTGHVCSPVAARIIRTPVLNIGLAPFESYS